jgi:hypothetical protein
LLQEVKRRTLPAWYANRNLLYSLDQLKLSPGARRRHEQLLKYCDLRLQLFDLFQMRLANGGDLHTDPQIGAVGHEIEMLLADMNGGQEEE